jgi:hypothetical protein
MDYVYSVQFLRRFNMSIPGMDGAKANARAKAAELDAKGLAEASETSQDASTDAAIGAMDTANRNQNRMAAASANFQTQGLARSTMLQAIRDVVKDGKDVVKDGGEAGHKP